MTHPRPISESTLRAALRVVLFVAASLIMLPLATVPIVIAGLFGSRARFRTVMALTPLWGRAVAFTIGLHVKVVGTRDRRARIFVGNHVGYLDIVVGAIGVGGVFVSRHDVVDWPVIGLFARLAGTVFIDRSSIRSAIASSAGIVDRARQGIRVTLFPEGGTSAGEGVREFRPFLFSAITQSAFIVQPFTIRYTRIGRTPIDSQNKTLVYWYDPAPAFNVHGWRLLKLPSVHATITFGDPVAPPAEAGQEAVRSFAAALREHVAQGLDAS